MLKTLLGLALGLSVAITSQAIAGFTGEDLANGRAWKHSTTSDPFNGNSQVVNGIGYDDDNQPRALIGIRMSYGEPWFSITNVSHYICPDIADSQQVTVKAWFSTGNFVEEYRWEASLDGSMVYGNFGADNLLPRMIGSDKIIFRIIDGCDKITDYWTTGGAELQAEWKKMLGGAGY